MPDFLVIGAQKAGTTSLYKVLSKHPEIAMPLKKELHLQRIGISAYRRHFEGMNPGVRAVGEATPVYISHPAAPALLKTFMPDARLILIVRNPVDRAYSQYWDNRRHLKESQTFERAIEMGLREEFVPGERGYFARGCYIHYIDRYLEYFDRSQMLVLFFDDLSLNPQHLYQTCFRFIGVEESFLPPEVARSFNRSSTWKNPIYRYLFRHPEVLDHLPLWLRLACCCGPRQEFRYPRMSEQSRERLREFYLPYNERLSAFTGRSLTHWSQ